MKIVTYAATADTAPPAHRFAARIILDDGTAHPVIFNGPNLAHLIDSANVWWAKELEKAATKTKPKAAEKAPEPAADPIDHDFEVI